MMWPPTKTLSSSGSVQVAGSKVGRCTRGNVGCSLTKIVSIAFSKLIDVNNARIVCSSSLVVWSAASCGDSWQLNRPVAKCCNRDCRLCRARTGLSSSLVPLAPACSRCELAVTSGRLVPGALMLGRLKVLSTASWAVDPANRSYEHTTPFFMQDSQGFSPSQDSFDRAQRSHAVRRLPGRPVLGSGRSFLELHARR